MKSELLSAWLRDARSMEKALADFSEKAAGDFKDHADIQDKLRAFADESKQTQAELDTSLDSMDESASSGKDLIGKLTGMVSGIGSSMYRDKAIKDVLVLHGALHFAHASYMSLAHAAKSTGNEALASTCARLAEQRRAMASWVEGLVPATTNEALVSG